MYRALPWEFTTEAYLKTFTSTKTRIDTSDLNMTNTRHAMNQQPWKGPRSIDYRSYYSLQNMFSGDGQSSLIENEDPSSTKLDVIPQSVLHPDSTNGTEATTLGSPRKSSFSAGDDHAPLLVEHKYYNVLTHAKSYPNPEYMLGLTDHEDFIAQGNITQKSFER